MSHCYGILFIEYVFKSHCLSHHYDHISPCCVILGPHILLIKYALIDNDDYYNNDTDNDNVNDNINNNNDNNSNNDNNNDKYNDKMINIMIKW